MSLGEGEDGGVEGSVCVCGGGGGGGRARRRSVHLDRDWVIVFGEA